MRHASRITLASRYPYHRSIVLAYHISIVLAVSLDGASGVGVFITRDLACFLTPCPVMAEEISIRLHGTRACLANYNI